MLVGYVSDERYVAIPEVLLEFEADGASIEARSRATGRSTRMWSPAGSTGSRWQAGISVTRACT